MIFKYLKKNNLGLCICVIILIISFLLIIITHKFDNIDNFQNEIYTEGLNNVDKILYINLENRKDRNEYISNQLQKYGVKKDKIHRINAHYTPGNGHLGCAKSHLDAIQYAIDNNLDNVIVFEDDFTFLNSPDDTKKMLNDFFNKVDKNEWDVVLFSHSKGETTDFKYPFIKKITNAQDGAGYIVNKKYFEILKNTFDKSVNNIRQKKTTQINFEPYALDQVWKKNQQVDQWMVFNPVLGRQNKNLESTIEAVTNYTDS